MQQQILNSIRAYYEKHKRIPRYLVLSSDLARRFEREHRGAEIPCVAFGLVIVEDKRTSGIAEMVEG